MAGRIRIPEQFYLTKFQGSIPEVPIAASIDQTMMFAQDTEAGTTPFVVTLGILKLNEISLNGLLYDEDLVNRIERQLVGEGGLRGHLGFFDYSQFPVNEVYWLGVTRDTEGVTWAKGYIPPGPGREDIRRRKAGGQSIGTSFDGFAVPEMVDEERGVWRARDFELVTLDLTHPKKASLQTGRWTGFKVTTETLHLLDTSRTQAAAALPAPLPQPPIEHEQEKMMSTETNPAAGQPGQPEPPAVAAEDVRALKRTHLEETRALNARIRELEDQARDLEVLRELLGNPDDVVTALRLVQISAEQLKKENGELLEDTIRLRVSSSVRMEAMREMVIDLVRQQKPVTRVQVDTLLAAVLDKPEVKAVLALSLAQEQGPPQARPVVPAPVTAANVPQSAYETLLPRPGQEA